MTVKIITAATTLDRIARQHTVAIDKAVEEINQIILGAKELPILIPCAVFPATESAREEIKRRLVAEGGYTLASVSPEPNADITHYKLSVKR